MCHCVSISSVRQESQIRVNYEPTKNIPSPRLGIDAPAARQPTGHMTAMTKGVSQPRCPGGGRTPRRGRPAATMTRRRRRRGHGIGRLLGRKGSTPPSSAGGGRLPNWKPCQQFPGHPNSSPSLKTKIPPSWFQVCLCTSFVGHSLLFVSQSGAFAADNKNAHTQAYLNFQLELCQLCLFCAIGLFPLYLAPEKPIWNFVCPNTIEKYSRIPSLYRHTSEADVSPPIRRFHPYGFPRVFSTVFSVLFLPVSWLRPDPSATEHLGLC